MELSLWLAKQDAIKLFMSWAKVDATPTQFLPERVDMVSETTCYFGRMLHHKQTVD
jgi:hypothetical protein